MTTALFRRAYALTISRNTLTGSEKKFFLPLPDGIVIADLRVRFTIEKSLETSPNTCVVKVDNLSPATRAELQNPGVVVRLQAGHDQAARHMFVGDLMWARSTQEGPQWVTEMELGDGARAYAHARTSRSFAKGTPVITVLEEAASSMGLTLSPEILRATDFRDQFSGGFVSHGRARDELTRLLAPYGYDWSIQDGRLQIIRDEDALGAPRLISEATGMIGTPEFDRPTRKRSSTFKTTTRTSATKGGTVTQTQTQSSSRGSKYRGPKATLKMFLYPELQPGHQVEVDSRALSGVFKVYKVKHEGDSHGHEWTTEIEVHA